MLHEKLETKTVFITKYALTQGILEAVVEVSAKFPRMVNVIGKSQYFHKPDWYDTLEEAQERVRALLERKRISLEHQLKRFQATEKTALSVKKV